jgi:hypothetical protein
MEDGIEPARRTDRALPGCRPAGTLRAVRLLPCAVALATATIASAAEPDLPPTVADLGSPRSVALSASRGLAGGNEGIFLNPAALAVRPRYAIETQWMLERAGADSIGQFLSLSVVDSQTSPVTGGVAITRVASGPSIGNAFHVALAAPLGGGAFLGVTGKYLRLHGAEDVNAATVDAALLLSLGRWVSAGIVGYDLVDVNHPQQMPLAVGAGLAIGDDRRFHLLFDWKRDFDRRETETDSWAAGGEVLVARNFPLRAGWQQDDTRGVTWWSAGAGLVTTAGLALDVAYRQAVDDSADRFFGVALKLFLVTQ